METVIWIAKAPDQRGGICWCKCPLEEAIAKPTGALDCPWCGCGWLFTCSTCRKAFMIGEAVEVSGTLEDMVRKEYQSWGIEEPTDAELAGPQGHLQQVQTRLEFGELYVHMDSMAVLLNSKPFTVEGERRKHFFKEAPHLTPRGIGMLKDQGYWEMQR